MKKRTKGIYTFSTKTFEDGFIKDRYTERTKEHGDNIMMDDYEILTFINSVLLWKKNIGPTKLYTDKKGKEFLGNCISLDIFDEIDTQTLEDFYKNSDVNHRQFFAASKVCALANEKVPFCSVDVDLIYRGDGKNLCKGELTTLHLEKITKSAYPNPKKFKENKNSNILTKYKWRKKTAINCGLLYFGNQEVLDTYTKEALNFMKNNPTEFDENDGRTTIMTCVEQRLLSEVAHKMKVKVKSLVKVPFNNEQPLDFLNETYHDFGIVPEISWDGLGVGLNGEVLHLWGHKIFLSQDLRVWDSILGGMKNEENERRLFLVYHLKREMYKNFESEYETIMGKLEDNTHIIKCNNFSRNINLGPQDNVFLSEEDKIFGA